MSRRQRSLSLQAVEPIRRIRAAPNFDVYFSYNNDMAALFRGMPEEEWVRFWQSQFVACVMELDTIVTCRNIIVKPSGEAFLKLSIYWLNWPFGRGWRKLRDADGFHDEMLHRLFTNLTLLP